MREGASSTSSREDTRVVYDRQTGEILHVHQALAVAGAKLPDESGLITSALDLASQMTGRPVEQMDVLSVPEEELNPHSRYKVNVLDRCLVAAQSDAPAKA